MDFTRCSLRRLRRSGYEINSTFVFFDGFAWTPRLRSPSPIMAPDWYQVRRCANHKDIKGIPRLNIMTSRRQIILKHTARHNLWPFFIVLPIERYWTVCKEFPWMTLVHGASSRHSIKRLPRPQASLPFSRAVPVELWDCCREKGRRASRFVPFPLSPALPSFFSLSQRRLGTRQIKRHIEGHSFDGRRYDVIRLLTSFPKTTWKLNLYRAMVNTVVAWSFSLHTNWRWKTSKTEEFHSCQWNICKLLEWKNRLTSSRVWEIRIHALEQEISRCTLCQIQITSRTWNLGFDHTSCRTMPDIN